MITSIALSIAAKVLQAILSFAIVHDLVSAWGASRYGVWATMTSVISYTALFDLGVGYGIKNKISEAQALGRLADAEAHARFGFLFYLGAGVVILVGGAVSIQHVSPFREHALAATLLLAGFVANFVLSFANIILQALGRFRLLSAIALVVPAAWYVYLCLGGDAAGTRVASAAGVYAVLLIVQGGLLAVAVARVWSFRWAGRITDLRRLAGPLLATGGKFFALQFTSLILFYSGNLLTFQFLGPAQTARYDATMKVFSIFSLGFSLVISVAWTEISKAKSSINPARLRHIFYGLGACAAGVAVAAGMAAWFAPSLVLALTNISIDRSEAVPFAVLVSVQAAAFAGAVYLNAFERLSGQVMLSIGSLPVFFGVAIALFNGQFGIGTVALASSVATAPALVYSLWSAWKIVHPAPAVQAWVAT